MKVFWNIFVVLVLISTAGMVGFYIGHRAAAPAETQDADDTDDITPVPTVQTTTIESGHLDRMITEYGSVTAQAADVSLLSVPFECRVKKVLVIPGQRLMSQSPVIDLEPSSDTRLQMLQAKSAADAAQSDLDQTRRRFADHLATNQDLLQSEQNLQQAQLKLNALQHEGAAGDVELKAAGLVEKVDVQEGQVIPPGASLVEVGSGLAQQVRLGVEPSDAGQIHVDDPVSLQAVRTDLPPVRGSVKMIAQRIDPDSRLVDVIVSLPKENPLPLDAFVRGQIIVAGGGGLIVPRSAVLPDDQGYSIFTVDGDKVVKRAVTIAGQNDQAMQITGDGLSAGQAVITVGNMELEDGMSVKIQPSGDASTTQPAAQEAAQ